MTTTAAAAVTVPKPKPLPIVPEGIPQDLRVAPQWLVWRWEWMPDKQKWDKPPFSIRTGRKCNDGELTSLATFDEALAAQRAGRYDGIGFRFRAEDPFGGLDLDDCRDPETGELTEEAKAIIGRLNTYTEVSPSGTGAKAYFCGKLPWGSKADHEIGMEAYDQGRYFCVTGRHLEDTPTTLRAIDQDELREILMFAFGVDENANPPREYPESDPRELALDALAGLSKGRVDGYWDWIRVGMALKSADESLLDNWDSWSAASDKHRAGECAKKWRSFKGKSRNVGIGSLVHMARQDGWRAPWERNGHGKAPRAKRQRPPADARFTDAENAQRFAEKYAGTVRYCWPWVKWLVWDGHRYAIDNQGRIPRLAKELVRGWYSEAAKIENEKLRAAFIAHVRSTERAPRINAMIELARSEPGIPVMPEELDKDDWQLNCPNGTLDLRTGQLREHRREDLITKLCPVEYDPAAECPLWMAFNEHIFAERLPLAEFMQRVAGYCFSGSVIEQVLMILYGVGANGKSTWLDLLLDLLGPDYAMKAPPDLLMLKRGETHPTAQADLHGKRLVVAVETEDGRRLAESLVKELTGGDKIRARRMREDFWQFRATHKILLATNHRPEVRGTDWAIWRRLRLIPFDVVIPPGQQDKRLAEKLRHELPGILAWAVAGCLDWQRAGLGEPEEVTKATDSYRIDQDLLGDFLAACCLTGDGFRARSTTLFDAFKEWTGEKHASQRRFGRALQERGFQRFTNNGTWYKGIALEGPTEPTE